MFIGTHGIDMKLETIGKHNGNILKYLNKSMTLIKATGLLVLTSFECLTTHILAVVRFSTNRLQLQRGQNKKYQLSLSVCEQ